MAAQLMRSASSSFSIVALVVFMIVMESARYSNADAATESSTCEVPSLPLEVIDLISNVNVTLQTLRTLLLAPPSGEEEEGGSLDNSTSERPVDKTNLLLLLLRKMEAENRQLSDKLNRLEEDQTNIRKQAIQTSLGLKNVQAESQKSDTPCHSTQWPRDCHDLLEQGKNESGMYTIYPKKCGFVTEGGVRVFCDLEGEEAGWTTVLLRRPLEEQVDFNQGWRQYRVGFGNPETEFWMGNDLLHVMTSGRMQMLRVDMMDWDGNTRYAEYGSFLVESADYQYQLHLGGYSGNAGDALAYHNSMLFSTPDRDNDKHGSIHCAHTRKGGFWYNACEYAAATNQLLKKSKNSLGVTWREWQKDYTTLQRMSYKIKPAICLRR